jgi:hypothetical protein
VSRTVLAALALLCVVGFLLIARRASETRSSEPFPDAGPRGAPRKTSLEDDIDWDELERAEEEIRDVDPMANPEDGFEGDDWGPGTAPKPPRV